jgi:hypothetical protein
VAVWPEWLAYAWLAVSVLCGVWAGVWQDCAFIRWHKSTLSCSVAGG